MHPDFLRKLETEIREMRGRELAGFLSFDVFVKVMCRYVCQWTPSTDIYLKVRAIRFACSLTQGSMQPRVFYSIRLTCGACASYTVALCADGG